MAYGKTIRILDSLVAAEANLNNTDLPRETLKSRTKTYFEVLKEMGLTAGSQGWLRRFHSLRTSMQSLNNNHDPNNNAAVKYHNKRRTYQGAIARVQTDNVVPFYSSSHQSTGPWNNVPVVDKNFPIGDDNTILQPNHPTISAPGILLLVIQGEADPTLPYRKKKEIYTARSKQHNRRTRSPRGHSLTASVSNGTSSSAHRVSHKKRHTPPPSVIGRKTKTRRTGRGAEHRITESDKKAQIYCPHMQKHDNTYVKTNSSHILRYKGHKYSFRTCCRQCANVIQTNPKHYVVTVKNKKCYIGLRHSTTDQIVQYAKKTTRTCRRK